ncbi:hypothetical protein CLHUN_41060 [Ruminiclostridium hungatei]|uniref:Uncharacterized protein n=1 Tax=Ruminiclostridium hungatei TaxID=48256 RepID=A0A1V4SDK2_RUMHU|nr:hypothetical protein CLHUN_41060 [Ruminiclostridium hungatei]
MNSKDENKIILYQDDNGITNVSQKIFSLKSNCSV